MSKTNPLPPRDRRNLHPYRLGEGSCRFANDLEVVNKPDLTLLILGEVFHRNRNESLDPVDGLDNIPQPFMGRPHIGTASSKTRSRNRGFSIRTLRSEEHT